MSAPPTPTLSDDQLDQLADLIAERLASKLSAPESAAPAELLDAGQVAERYGVSRGFIYDHRDELGAVYLGEPGDGRRPRLRFHAGTVAEFFARPHESAGAETPPAPPAKPSCRPPSPSGTPLLPITGASR